MGRTPERFGASLLAFLLSPAILGAQDALPAARIGMLLDGPSVRTAPLEAEIRSEIQALLASDFAISFPAARRIEGEWSFQSVADGLEALIAAGDLDLVLALGPIATEAAVARRPLPVPVVAPFSIEVSRRLPISNGTSGVPNLNYLFVPNTIARDLAVLSEVLPIDTVAVLVSEPYLTAIPDLSSEAARTGAPGIEVSLVSVPTPDPASVVSNLPPGVDALYLTPLMPLSEEGLATLLGAAIEAGLPTLSSLGVEEVAAGALMTLTPPNDEQRLARRVALHAQRILLGTPAQDLPVGFSRGRRITINMATARRTGVFPPWSVLTEAELLNEPVPETARTLDLETVLEEAQVRSLELLSQDRRVAAAESRVGDARATLLPQLGVSTLGTVIDQDRAEASLGAAPQRSVALTGSVTQVLYSDAAWTGLAVEGHSARATREDRESTRLDAMERAGIAYLDVLRAQTLERIQRENLRTTRSFLELAEVREAIGDANPGEVYRWQAQIASDRQRVLGAQAARGQAATEVNRILDRPLEEPFRTAEPDLADPFLITSDPRLTALTGDPWSFPVFRDFMVQEAMRESTELARMESLLSLRRRVHQGTRRAFWMPEVALQGTISQRVAEGGAGTEGLAIPPSGPDGPALADLFPQVNDFSWSLGLQASIPLFTSGGRPARREEALMELRALERDRDAVALGIEQRMRVALLAAGASLPSIDLAQQAAEAARRNLELVRDAYTEGAVSIAELLDAQNASLAAEEAAAAAVYDFLIDLMSVERALGRLGFFHGDRRDDFFERAEAFRERARRADRP